MESLNEIPLKISYIIRQFFSKVKLASRKRYLSQFNRQSEGLYHFYKITVYWIWFGRAKLLLSLFG